MEKIALMMLIDSEYKPYIWNHVEYAILSYFDIHQNYEIIACGGGVEKPPKNTSYDHRVWLNEQVNGNSIQNYIKVFPEAFQIAEETQCSKVLITPGLQWVENQSIFSERLAIIGELGKFPNMLDAKIMYGKVSTLKNILLNRKWDLVIDDEANMFKNVSNVVGADRVEDFVFKPSKFKVKKRTVLSRDFWGDEHC